MSLFRKIAFVAMLLAAIGFGIAGYFSLRNIKEPSADVLAYMPDSCVAYAEAISFHELNVKWNEQSLMALKWKVSEPVLQFSNSIRQLDSLQQQTASLKELLGSLPLSFAVYDLSGKMQWIAVLKLGELRHQKMLQEQFGASSAVSSELHKRGISSLLKDGMLLLSDSKELLEKGTGKGLKLSANKELKEMLQGVSSGDALRFYISQSLWHSAENKLYFQMPAFLQAQCYAAALKIQPNELVFNGNMKLSKDVYSVFWQNQQATELRNLQYLPEGTTAFRAYAVSNPEWMADSINTNDELADFWNSQNKKALYPVHRDFYLNLTNSFSVFEWQGKTALCFTVRDTTLFDETSKTLFEKDSLNNTFLISESDFVQKAFFRTYQNVSRVLVRRGQAVYVAEENALLNSMMFHLNFKGTLVSDEAFMTYASEHINPKANVVYYVSPQHNRNEIREWLNYDRVNESAYLENISDASLVISKQGNLFKFRAQINYQSSSSEGLPNLLWQCYLDTIGLQKPYLFTNHITGEHELVLQDASNQLYLINNRGTLLWKKKLEEPVRSEIAQVDLFRNGKHQIYFNTDQYLYMIDRNGKDVQGYPVRLPSRASNAISLIDYDGNGDIRAFIACENKSIYNFNLYGIKAEGYTPYKTEHAVKLPVKFARVGASDYLITIDEAGIIHAFSRKGDARIGFKNKAVQNCSDFRLLATNSIFNSCLFYVDEKNSLINKVSFNDKKEVIKLSHDLNESIIRFENMNDDFTPDFVSLSHIGTKVFDVNGNLLFENTTFKEADGFSFSNRSGKTIAIIHSSGQSKADIFKGLSAKSMNLKTTAMPAVYNLFKDERVYVLVVSENKLQCFLLK